MSVRGLVGGTWAARDMVECVVEECGKATTEAVVVMGACASSDDVSASALEVVECLLANLCECE